eukprot:6213103-Karenia_brevis.AAC.1
MHGEAGEEGGIEQFILQVLQSSSEAPEENKNYQCHCWLCVKFADDNHMSNLLTADYFAET